MVCPVLLEPVPTMTRLPAAAQTRVIVSMTACFSSSSSEEASPVVPSATMPATPAPRYSPQRRSIAAVSTAPAASNGVISGTHTPRRSRSLVMRRAYSPAVDGSRRRRSSPCTFPAVPFWLQVLLTLLVGFATGVLSGMFGIGGAVVSTPAIRALGATALQAVGSTLPSILPSSVSGSLRYRREGLIRNRVVAWTAAFGVPASIIGSRLSEAVPGNGHVLMLLTAALVAYTGYRTAFPTERTLERGADGLHDQWWTLAIIGVAAGGLSGLLGIGGGILMVPAFSAWVGMPLKETIATSLACVGIFAIPGTLAHWYLGHIDWTFAGALAVGVIPGARIGAHFTINASDRLLRYSVGAALGIIALIYGVSEALAWIS